MDGRKTCSGLGLTCSYFISSQVSCHWPPRLKQVHALAKQITAALALTQAFQARMLFKDADC